MKNKNFKKEKGSFILELMIGLFLSAVTILGVVYVYINFELNKNSTIQLGKTISTAAISLYPIQENLKMSGYGFNLAYLSTGCNLIKRYDSTLSNSFYNITVPTKPIDVVPAIDNKSSDQIILSYANSTIKTISDTPVTLNIDNNGSTQDWIIADASQFNVGDVTLIYNTSSPGTCIVQQVTTVNKITNTLSFESSKSSNNPNGGFGIFFPKTSTKLIKVDLNSIPKTLSFQIENNQLTQIDNIYDINKKSVVGDNIIMLKTSYGLDTNSDGFVDSWTNTIDNTNYQNIVGVKIGILARSLIRENKGLAGNSCYITTNSQFVWDNGLGTGIMDVSNLPDWKCYRYRMLQTTVPIKNILWSKT